MNTDVRHPDAGTPQRIPSAHPNTASPLMRRHHADALVSVVQQLSLARDLQSVMAIVRVAARELTGADGATFVLRDNDQCYYAEENAISPLWKGRRFPMDICISGWVMQHRQPAVIEDIYADDRIPAEAYRPTFVRSLAMVPIRTVEPIGAIGNYWARKRRPTDEEVAVLQALADSTAVALENVRVYEELEQRVQQRTAQLQAANEALRKEIGERQRAEAEVLRRSLTDELTGAHNRRGFFFLAEQELLVARRTHTPAWLLFADVDGLKEANDREGHEAGDTLLRDAAAVLLQTFRHADVIGRLGGDEFAVFAVMSDGDVDEIRLRLQREIDAFNAHHPRVAPLSLSVGVVSCPPESKEPLSDLLARADAAMYGHKRAKKQARMAARRVG